MKRKIYTMEELKEKARQGYFWEHNLEKWFHYSQVDTQEKARRLLKIGNPIHVIKLAQSSSIAVGPRLKGFWAWIYHHPIVCWLGMSLMFLFALLLPRMYGSSCSAFYDGNTIISLVVLAMLLCPITIYVVLALKIRRLDLDDASYALFVQAEDLKNGFIYDSFGCMQSFQK